MGEEKAVCILNSLLRGELSAVEFYNRVLAKLPCSDVRMELTELMTAHQKRASKLQRRLRQLGTTTGDNRGFGGFVFPSPDATLPSDREALSMLADCEEEAMHAYERAERLVDDHTRALLAEKLLPEQEGAHSVIAVLRDAPALIIKTA